MALTITQLKTLVYTRDVQLPTVSSDAVFLSLLDRAIVNVRSDLKSFEPDALYAWLENQTSPVTYPTDLTKDDIVLIFPSDEYIVPIGSQYISSRNGKWYIEGFTNFNIKYPKDLPRFTAMTETLPFTTRKAEEIIISELMALIYLTLDNNESTESVANSLAQSNRIK